MEFVIDVIWAFCAYAGSLPIVGREQERNVYVMNSWPINCVSKWEQSQHHTCLHAGLDDAYNRSPQHILSYGEVVVRVFEHRWRHQACHHADVDSGIGEGNQTTTILGRDYHRNNRIGLPKNGPRQGDHTCKFKTTGTFQRGVFKVTPYKSSKKILL